MPSKRMVLEQELSDAGEDLVRLAAAKDAEIAALTEQRDAFSAASMERLRAFLQEHEKVKALTEERDRAMKVVEAAQALGEAMNECKPCDKEFGALWAALDAEAAAETAPSLPETP